MPSTGKTGQSHFRDYLLTGHAPDMPKSTRMTHNGLSCSGSLRRSSPPRQEFHFMVTERGADTPRSAGYATIYRCLRGDISKELTMTKSILVSLAILTLYFCRFGRASDSSSPRDS